MARDTSPRFSVVILTYNRRDLLRRCLEAVTTLDYPNYEVIVIEDGSTDGSAEMVHATFPQVRYLAHAVNTGEPTARNRGLAAATGEIIAFTDDDCVPPHDWLQRHARHHRNPRISAAGGPLVCRAPTFYDHFDAAHSIAPYSAEQIVERVDRYEHVGTGNMSVRRDVAQRVGPFDEHFITGCDTDFVRRLSRSGYLFARDPDLQVEHAKSLTLRSFLHMRFHRGCGSVLTDVKEGTLTPRRFVPLIPLGPSWHNWRRFRRQHGGGAGAALRFWGLALLTRWVDVAGRAYYYWTIGRRYQAPDSALAHVADP